MKTVKMTTKELKQCAAIYMQTDEDEQPILWRYQFKEDELKYFCAQLCKEQREECAQNSSSKMMGEVRKSPLISDSL